MKDKVVNNMRNGFTTGSCAAAASAAATYMLLSGQEKTEIVIETPKGIPYHAEILEICREENFVHCAVQKDGGDDIDATDKMLIYSRVSFSEEPGIHIEGGDGIGRVTKPGLDQVIGEAAINSTPREMITNEIGKICNLFDYHGGLDVIIYAPEGEAIAKKTFNERLGIVGGISILGTTGIVEPMSIEALLETIRIELRQKREFGRTSVAVSPGNYGLEFMRQMFEYDLDQSVKCSNYIGATMDMARELGFQSVLLTGHIGKLIKVSGGIMNTHSHEADCRMELLVSAALKAGVANDVLLQILDCVSTEEAVRILSKTGLLSDTMQIVVDRIQFYLQFRCEGAMQTECMVYSKDYGLLGETSGARKLLDEIKKETNS